MNYVEWQNERYGAYWMVANWIKERKLNTNAIIWNNVERPPGFVRESIDHLIFAVFDVSGYTALNRVINQEYPWFWGPNALPLFKVLLIKKGLM
jgi:hypothetical protein